jgi:hypothetical protein
MPRKIELSPSFLRERYHEEGKTLSEIAEEVGCSPATVHNRMEEHGIERRHPKAWKDRMTVTCANCGSEKDVEQTHFEAFDRFYCDNECQLCGRSDDGEGRVPDVHHIEPVRSFETEDAAHEPDNLIQLCRSCHVQMEQLKPERQRAIFERKESGPFDETVS